jgi:fructokinase
MNPNVGRRLGGIEAGGTKFVCAVAVETGGGAPEILAETRFPTTTPQETIGQALRFFQEQAEPVAAVGVGAFGPVDPNPRSLTFGYITTTPKPGWAQTDFAGALQADLGVPVGFDTDVNAAALSEHNWGAGQGLDDLLYLTVGTGIGGGALVNGQLLHGLIHPEMGHILLPHDWEADPYPGHCPFHGDCFEGLACGPAMAGRWGRPAQELSPDHPAWELEAHYLALALAGYICTLSPQRIILGGGVMSGPGLLPRVRRNVQQVLKGYVAAAELAGGIDDYITLPGLGNRAGVLGAIALAQQALG